MWNDVLLTTQYNKNTTKKVQALTSKLTSATSLSTSYGDHLMGSQMGGRLGVSI